MLTPFYGNDEPLDWDKHETNLGCGATNSLKFEFRVLTSSTYSEFCEQEFVLENRVRDTGIELPEFQTWRKDTHQLY